MAQVSNKKPDYCKLHHSRKCQYLLQVLIDSQSDQFPTFVSFCSFLQEQNNQVQQHSAMMDCCIKIENINLQTGSSMHKKLGKCITFILLKWYSSISKSRVSPLLEKRRQLAHKVTKCHTKESSNHQCTQNCSLADSSTDQDLDHNTNAKNRT